MAQAKTDIAAVLAPLYPSGALSDYATCAPVKPPFVWFPKILLHIKTLEASDRGVVTDA